MDFANVTFDVRVVLTCTKFPVAKRDKCEIPKFHWTFGFRVICETACAWLLGGPERPMEFLMQQVNESTLRARAKARGYYICKSRERSTHWNNQGEYQLVEAHRNMVVLGVHYDASLPEIASFLSKIEPERAPRWH
jgi:hypothetical protein